MIEIVQDVCGLQVRWTEVSGGPRGPDRTPKTPGGSFKPRKYEKEVQADGGGRAKTVGTGRTLGPRAGEQIAKGD